MLSFNQIKEIVLQYVAYYVPYFAQFQSIEDVKDEDDQKIELKLSTPEEIFAEKILSENYDEALEVANKYGLDSDLVYQTQWKKASVTSESIERFLSHVEDIDWVIHECTNRIAESIEGQTRLLELGLKYTSLESILDLNDSDSELQGFDEVDEEHEGVNEPSPEPNLRELLTADKTTLVQKQRIISRFKILRYQNKLKTLERILGQIGAKIQFDPSFYDQFRNESAFASALTFAHSSNFKAVGLLLTHEGRETLENWLPILSNFPEVLSPFVYRNLLPECGASESDEDVYQWEEAPRREDDWCEKHCGSFCDVLNWRDFDREFYESYPAMRKYKGKSLSKSILSAWYTERSKQIEEYTSVVDNSLQLVKLGIERNVPGLVRLHDDLETFATVVYDCIPRSSRANVMKFSDFEKMTNKEVVSLLMLGSGSNDKTFLKCVKQFLIPYLHKYDKYNSEPQFQKIFVDYLVDIGKNDLSLCRAVFEDNVREDQSSENVKDEEKDLDDDPMFTDVKLLLELALKVVYSSDQVDQLDEAFKIVECLPQRTEDASSEMCKLQDDVDNLEKHLAVAELLEKYDCHTCLSKLKYLQTEAKASEVKHLFERITKLAPKKDTSKVFSDKDWTQLFHDLQVVHKDCFEHVFQRSYVSEIVVKALLSTGKREDFALASKLMNSMDHEEKTEVVLEAARGYLNAASTMSDDLISMAKDCLSLIKTADVEVNEKVKEELDFIEAMSLLDHEFDLKLLPVQIRLIEAPRMDLLDKILISTRGSYKKVGKVLRLAELLRICSDMSPVEREATILSVMGLDALKFRDYSTCWLLCQRIVNSELISGWDICLRLGRSDQFGDKEARLLLLSFALTYCDSPDGCLLSEILNEISELRSLLYNETNFGFNDLGLQKISENVTKIGSHVSKTAQQLSTWILPSIPKPSFVTESKTPVSKESSLQVATEVESSDIEDDAGIEKDWGDEWDDF